MADKPKTIEKLLPVALTTPEKAERGLQLAKHIKRRLDIVEDKRAFLADMRARLLTLDEKICDVQTVVRTGKELRKMKCKIRMDYKLNKVLTVRIDTGETVETRAMKSSERQDELDFQGAKRATAA